MVDTQRRLRGTSNLVTAVTFSLESLVRTYQNIRRHISEDNLYVTAV